VNVRKAIAIGSALTAILVVLAGPSSASALVTVGQTSSSELVNCSEPLPYDELQTSISGGNSYVAPANGVLTSWSTYSGPVSGQSLGLKVFRPQGGISYKVVAHDGPHSLTPNVLNTFPVSIPVQAGDVIGTFVPENSEVACTFETHSSGDVIGYRAGNNADGASFELEETYSGVRVNLSATLLPPPTIASISPATGSIAGASVVIAGANFASVQSVSFGSAPATSFTVNSEGQITAVAPPSATLASVPVTVTTVAGSASSAQAFAYEGCLVPSLKGKKLKAAKKKAQKANCKIGKVKKLGDATTKTGKVSKQSPKPGKILAPGSKINVKLKA
jgi:PASTA domain-containing protein/IPT/TIG domain-containing protein